MTHYNVIIVCISFDLKCIHLIDATIDYAKLHSIAGYISKFILQILINVKN